MNQGIKAVVTPNTFTHWVTYIFYPLISGFFKTGVPVSQRGHVLSREHSKGQNELQVRADSREVWIPCAQGPENERGHHSGKDNGSWCSGGRTVAFTK